MRPKIIILFAIISVLFTLNCTELEEKFGGSLTEEQVSSETNSNVDALLAGVYDAMRPAFSSPYGIFRYNEIPSDEAIAPTRGPDWDDNGIWREMFLHKWSATSDYILEIYSALNGVNFAATNLLQFSPTPQQEAEARFCRALSHFWLLDFYNQVPYREPGESVIGESKVRKGVEALNYIISEIEAVYDNLPDEVYLANKDAAKVLLMKCYLNKAVYENRATPSFDPADMNKVIELADDIINTGKYQFSANYFDNFGPENTALGLENIWTQLNVGGGATPSNFIFYYWILVFHGSMGGWNGWATLPDFYNKYEASDLRAGQAYAVPNYPPNPGNRRSVGFLVGPQYSLYDDSPIPDNSGAPLSYLPEVHLIERENLEHPGIRPLKYAQDLENTYDPNNDWVYFRLPDVLLMKAEAILRGGTATDAGPYGGTPLSIVNSIRTDPSRGASALSSVDLATLLDERGRELWWEGWRRHDQIRFGTFLGTWDQKPEQSDTRALLFPVPATQVAVNPNLEINPGY